MGRNLICIHSKKYIKVPPEDAAKKQAQNLESMKVVYGLNLLFRCTYVSNRNDYSNPIFLSKNVRMQAMGDLFARGGSVFWVAPSGGRDRPDETGEFVVAPFDSKVLDMFKILAIQSAKPLSFFPMAMYSNQLVPPPKSVRSVVSIRCLQS